MISCYDIKSCVEDLRAIESYGETLISSYEAGELADLIEEQDGVIRDLMFENDSKQKRINKLQYKLEQIKKGQLNYGN